MQHFISAGGQDHYNTSRHQHIEVDCGAIYAQNATTTLCMQLKAADGNQRDKFTCI